MSNFTLLLKSVLTVKWQMSLCMTKPTKWPVHPAKTHISLGIHPVWSESSLSAWRKLGSLATHWVHSEDSDQTGWMPRLIWVFAGRIGHFVGFVMRMLKYSLYTVMQSKSCSAKKLHLKVAKLAYKVKKDWLINTLDWKPDTKYWWSNSTNEEARNWVTEAPNLCYFS